MFHVKHLAIITLTKVDPSVESLVRDRPGFDSARSLVRVEAHKLPFPPFTVLGYDEIVVTSAMRRAGAIALEDGEGVLSFEEKAEAAYKAMVSLDTHPK